MRLLTLLSQFRIFYSHEFLTATLANATMVNNSYHANITNDDDESYTDFLFMLLDFKMELRMERSSSRHFTS